MGVKAGPSSCQRLGGSGYGFRLSPRAALNEDVQAFRAITHAAQRPGYARGSRAAATWRAYESVNVERSVRTDPCAAPAYCWTPLPALVQIHGLKGSTFKLSQ